MEGRGERVGIRASQLHNRNRKKATVVVNSVWLLIFFFFFSFNLEIIPSIHGKKIKTWRFERLEWRTNPGCRRSGVNFRIIYFRSAENAVRLLRARSDNVATKRHILSFVTVSDEQPGYKTSERLFCHPVRNTVPG